MRRRISQGDTRQQVAQQSVVVAQVNGRLLRWIFTPNCLHPGAPLLSLCGMNDPGNAPRRDGTGAGVMLVLLAVVIWAAWLPATRIAIGDGLGAVDIAFLRYVVPAVMLAPIWWRIGLLPKGVSFPMLLAMLCWGAPFTLLTATGLQQASVAHTAALIPCTMPVLAAFAALVLYGERIPRERLIGIALIAFAAACVLFTVLKGGSTTDLPTVGLLLLASAGWAAYTVAYRRSGLTPMEAGAVVFVWSALFLIPAIFLTGSGLGALPLSALTFHVVAQGILSGFVATIAYGIAIDRLGVPRAASFSVLVPVLATIMAFLWIGEKPSLLDGVALAIGTLGVAVVNGAISLRR